MEKEVKLARKIKRFLRRLGCPRWLHRFGPKTYELWQHVLGLLAIAIFRLSLRRVSLLTMLGLKLPTYSALCKSRKRIPTEIWNKILSLTGGSKHDSVAIDATGFSRTNPSLHYMFRIDGLKVKRFAKMSMLFGIEKRKIIAMKVRVNPASEIRDIKPLLKRYFEMKSLLGDKLYDIEWLHEMCFWKGIDTYIPSKITTKKGFFRRKQKKHFSLDKYHQRSLIESGFSAIKRRYGGSVSGKSLAAVNSEISCKAIAYNMGLEE